MTTNKIFTQWQRWGLISSLLFLPAILLTSCDEEMMDYEGTDVVYLMHYERSGGYEYNTASVNLMDVTDSEMLFPLSVTISGQIRDYDRPYLIAAVDSSTAVAGEDYILPSGGVIKAGEYNDTIYVRLLKNDKLLNQEVKLIVKVLPNEHFTTDLSKYTTKRDFDPCIFELTFTSMMSKPYWWFSEHGTFSVKKITLINELFNMTYNDWADVAGARMEGGSWRKFVRLKFCDYLLEQYQNHTPVLEDDGTLMWVNGCPWPNGTVWDGNYVDY